MEFNSIILRYGEVALKSDKSRAFFEKKYIQAIKDSLKSYKDVKIKSYGKRFILLFDEEIDKNVISILQKIPGIQSFSLAHFHKFQQEEDLRNYLINLTKPLIQNKTFRITTRRIGKHTFSSMDFSMNLGKELEPFSNGVNLNHPQINIQVEIRETEAYIYTESIEGMGGLPPATAGKVLALFSGGIDSPVAAYQMLKRGCSVDFIYINLLGDAPFTELAKVYNHLIHNYAKLYVPKLYVVDAAEIVKQIKSDVDSSLRQIFLKIIFYKISQQIAKGKYDAIVTGEALSQKSSQTLKSLAVIDSQSTMLTLRPLLGMDKTEIVEIARQIETFDLSEKVKEYCNLSEGPVSTNPSLDILNKFPDLTNEIQQACENHLLFKGEIEIIEQEIQLNNPKIISICQTKKIDADYQEEYPQILDKLDSFPKDQDYLIICDFGVRSFDVANKFRKLGINANSQSIKQYLKEPSSCFKL